MTQEYTNEVRRLVTEAALVERVVNVPVIASRIHSRNPKQSIFEIESLVLGFAQLSGVPIVFDQPQPKMPYKSGLMVEFVTDGDEDVTDIAAPRRARSRDEADSAD